MKEARLSNRQEVSRGSKALDDYYQSCPFPKPKPTKKPKRKQNGFKDKPQRICWYTGEPNAERHEVFPGIYRQTSIDMGFQVDVCPRIHRELQVNGTDWARAENRKWRMFFQKRYEDKLIETGITEEQARACWMDLMGRNYL